MPHGVNVSRLNQSFLQVLDKPQHYSLGMSPAFCTLALGRGQTPIIPSRHYSHFIKWNSTAINLIPLKNKASCQLTHSLLNISVGLSENR